MKIDIRQITEGEESIVIRYRELTPDLGRIIGILNDEESKLWGKSDGEDCSASFDEILYLESVDDKVFAYTSRKVLRIDGSLNSFMNDVKDDSFFRCSKSMIINLNHVSSLKSLSSNRIDATLENGEHIMISRRYASNFRKLLRGYNRDEK
ncbi:MAG: LytTR family transcriptional regulator DNA-binding domain-containing protein [Lachnospiraceae bacterium]|nr:LytTR family transcriptional regulator DNA-binding domain-containing protein [Lachnospiraceae bacterium]